MRTDFWGKRAVCTSPGEFRAEVRALGTRSPAWDARRSWALEGTERWMGEWAPWQVASFLLPWASLCPGGVGTRALLSALTIPKWTDRDELGLGLADFCWW